MLDRITEEELSFMECLHTPRCLIESLFHNFDNLSLFSEEKLGSVRIGQLPFFSHEPIIDFEGTAKYHSLDKKGERKLRKNVADIYHLSARNLGKTLVVEKLDIPVSMIHDNGIPVGLASADGNHLREVMNPIKSAIDTHSILKIWRRNTRSQPEYFFEGRNGWNLTGVNMKVNSSKNPGENFFGKHFKKLWIEEFSLESNEVYEKRKDAISDLGCVYRASGMLNFTKHSPAGQIYYDRELKDKILSLPLFVNPNWDDAMREDRKKKYGGFGTIGWKIFVEAEVVETGKSEFDIERIRDCYLQRREITRFEVTKEHYKTQKDNLVLERPKNAQRIFIAGDVGDHQSEIEVWSELHDDRYKYLYNITLYDLIQKQQLKVFIDIIEKLNANIIAIDCGDALGRGLCDDLEERYDVSNVVRYQGASKINVGLLKDENGKTIIKKGKLQFRQEKMSIWSVKQIKTLFYNKRITMPEDYRLDRQINQVIRIPSGNSFRFECIAEDDHLWDATRVFAISVFLKADFNATPKMKRDFKASANSWT